MNNTVSAVSRSVCLVSLSFGILGFTLPVYGNEIGADAMEIGLFFSAFSLMTVLPKRSEGANGALDGAPG